MQKLHIFGVHQRALANLLRDLLEQEGIACLIKNEQLFIGLGEIPFVEVFPELWVVDDDVLPRARRILEQWLAEKPVTNHVWLCDTCNEVHEEQFGSCWQCGRKRPSEK